MIQSHLSIQGRNLCLLALYLLLWQTPAHANNSEPLDLAPYIQFFAESDTRNTLQQAIQSDAWQNAEGNVNFGFNADSYWLYVDLTSFTHSGNETVLELDYSFLDFADAYFMVDGELVNHQSNGDGYPVSQRPINNPAILFVPPSIFDNKLELYLHIESEGAVKAPLVLWNAKNFNQHNHLRSIGNGLFVGALLIMMLYHLFLFSVLRELSVVLYLFYLGSYMLLQLVISGQGYQLLWPTHPEWNNNLLIFSMNTISILGVSFGYVFLSLHKMSWKIQLIPLILIFNSIIFLSLQPFLSYETLILPNVLTIAVNTIFSVGIGFYLWFKGIRIARFFSIAWGVFILGTTIYILMVLGHIPINIFTNNIIAICAAIQMSLHALALADKFREERITAEKSIIELNENLEHRITQRTEQLADSLEQLKISQNELVQSEKMAALGGLVSGVAHEINTPLGVGISAASLLQARSELLGEKYSSNQLERTEMESYIAVAKESSALILSSLQRASDQISSFKTVAVDQSHDALRRFNVKQYLDELLVTFKPKLKQLNVVTHIDCDEKIIIPSYPGLFAQLFTHLLSNSLDHAFKEQDRGKITIKIEKANNTLSIHFLDNGIGVSENEQKHLFEPFYTTERSQGHTGLGTFVIFNTVCHGLGGSITHESQRNEGLRYHITIPLQQEVK